MPTINLLFFGAVADLTGTREVSLQTHCSTGRDLIRHITVEHPGLASQKLLIAINQEHAAPDATISDGDEVAIFTAVSGG